MKAFSTAAARGKLLPMPDDLAARAKRSQSESQEERQKLRSELEVMRREVEWHEEKRAALEGTMAELRKARGEGAVAGKTLHLLHVEDNADDVFFFERAVRSAGVPIESAYVSDREAALLWLQTSAAKPDLILLDIRMPRMNGLEFLAEVKAGPYSDVRVVMFSTSGHRTDVQRAKELGADACWVKPPGISELGVVVERLYASWASGLIPSEWPAQEAAPDGPPAQ
jgi:CheY-like chemotaxis protein